MIDRFIVDNFGEVRDTAIRNDLKVFELIRAESYVGHGGRLVYLSAYKTIQHVHINSDDVENIIRSEGIELKIKGTDFGLKEMIMIKIK